jgi:hypothetical protein
MFWVFVLCVIAVIHAYIYFEIMGDARPFQLACLATFIYLGIWLVVKINNNDIPLWRTP